MNRRTTTSATLLLSWLLIGACGVESRGRDTGGIDLPRDDGGPPLAAPDGSTVDGRASPPQGPRTRGFVVVNSDYQSSSVSLLSTAGDVLSESFISSRSEKPGLSTALGKDIGTPGSTVPGNEVVLIDKNLTAVLTWVNLETANVRAQLSVTTGFGSNPHDYVPYLPTKAFVTRFEPNLDAGKEPFDGGNDVLVIDPSGPEITGRIDLMPTMEGAPASFYPRASGALMAGGKLRVLALGMNLAFTEHTDSRLVTIDPETHVIEHVLVIPTLRGCGSGEVSPDGTRLAIVCSGSYLSDPAEGFADSGLVLVDLTDVPTVSRQTSCKELGIGQLRSAEWTSDDTLLLVTTGRFDEDHIHVHSNGTVRLLPLSTWAPSAPLLETGKDPFDFGSARCDLHARRCFVPDAGADGGVLHELLLRNDGAVTLTRRIKVDRQLGYPPRSIGRF